MKICSRHHVASGAAGYPRGRLHRNAPVQLQAAKAARAVDRAAGAVGDPARAATAESPPIFLNFSRFPGVQTVKIHSKREGAVRAPAAERAQHPSDREALLT